MTKALANRCVHATIITLAGAVLFNVPAAQGQVYKCEDGAGKTVYSDAPCAGKKLAIPGGSKGGALTEGTVCAQLLDERRRLAAEAERNAKRGRAESADSIKRRQNLARQYERRCIGISRSRD